jgi:predicted RNA-binding Zn-ribbon protein involved in translation (DUF1610 family)
MNHNGQTGLTKKKQKTRTRRNTFCPKCGSTNIFWASGLPQLWSAWDCRNCGYRGAFILEDGGLAAKLEEEYARRAARS